MKHLIKSVFGLLFTVFFTQLIHAAPAFPGVTEIIQPNGAVVEARIRGDEWNSWIETLDGYSIAENESGYWEYVTSFTRQTPNLSGVYANRIPPLHLQKGVVPTLRKITRRSTFRTDSPTQRRNPGGTQKTSVVFVLAEFTDRKGTYSQASFAKFLKNNIADYFKKASNGRVKITPAKETHGTKNNGVIGWINLKYDHPNFGGGGGNRAWILTRKAMIAADKYIDYEYYDKNKDGYTDADELAVMVIVAGYEAAYTTSKPNIWAHAWEVFSPPKLDNVRVGARRGNVMGYSMFGEIQGDHQATMGVMVHELGHHIFGLPDLYDIDGSSGGIGIWGVMSSGTWGQKPSDKYAGETPNFPSAWVRHTMEWVDTITVKRGTKTFVPIGLNFTGKKQVYKFETPDPLEYFLVEGRGSVSYDKGMHKWLGANGFGGGLYWHIDENQANNADDTHRLVDLEEADGTENSGELSDFWGIGFGPSVFGPGATAPNSKRYNGSASGLCIKKPIIGTKSGKATFGCY